MSYNELSRRELQSMCKEYGLPANKTNAVMASSLTNFLGDPKNTVLARTPQVITPAVVKKPSKAKALQKPEMQETSLAALLLAAKTRNLVNDGKLLKKGRDFPDGRPIKANLSAVTFPAPANNAADCILPKTTPFLRRRKNSDMTPSTVAGNTTFTDFARDPTENESLLPEETSVEATRSVSTLSTHEPQLVSTQLNAAILDTCNEGCQVKKWSQKHVHPALSPLLQITANVDNLINRATAMLEKFQDWKVDLPQEPEIDRALGTWK